MFINCQSFDIFMTNARENRPYFILDVLYFNNKFRLVDVTFAFTKFD